MTEDILELTNLVRKGSENLDSSNTKGENNKSGNLKETEKTPPETTPSTNNEEDLEDYTDLETLIRETQLQKENSPKEGQGVSKGGGIENESTGKQKYTASKEQNKETTLKEFQKTVQNVKNEGVKGPSQVSNNSSDEEKEESKKDVPSELSATQGKFIEDIKNSLEEIQKKDSSNVSEEVEKTKTESQDNTYQSQDNILVPPTQQPLLSQQEQDTILASLNKLGKVVDSGKVSDLSESFSNIELEDLIRPMVQDWMKKNLGNIVQQIVEKEVENIIKKIN